MKKQKIPSEHEEQVGFINWFRENYPELIIFAVPNGGMRHPRVAEKLKAEGVMAGVPDLCVLLPDAKVVWVEMKRVKGSRLSSDQKEFIQKAHDYGHTVLVCKGATDASMQIIDYFNKKDEQK